VREKANQLVPLINGVAKAHVPGFEPVSLGVCVDWVRPDGRLARRFTDTVTLHARSGARVAEKAAVTATLMKEWMSVSIGNAEAIDVLRLWGTAPVHDWSTLYKIREKIEARVGSKIVRLGWASRRELERFDRTACSPDVIGDAARHGVQKGIPPHQPMSIEQAHQLIQRLIRGWMELLRHDPYVSGSPVGRLKCAASW
jgi:hypothetical protein